jgi:asparagine synthase (glutamine-hydrolysing)
MCGIHLIWGKGADKEAIDILLAAGRHRGPDQESTFSPWPGIWIGVNRLKIIHPGPNADQPFWSPDGNYFLTWNGEIYNYKDLGRQVQKMGVDLITDSDTEVLIHWLRLFGVEGLEKLEGMFSLILGSTVEKSILVARDKNGEKPLFYVQNPDHLIISSDTRGIRKLKSSTLDPEQFNHYFYLRAPLPGKTFFREIREWKPDRSSTISQYSTFRWNSIGNAKENKMSPSAEEFKTRLESAVQNQFHADVPLGLQLSGGADSSLLYAIWYKQSASKLPVFTIGLEDSYQKKYSDSESAKRFLKQFPADHHLIHINQEKFLINWDEYVKSIDLPVGDSAGFLTWMIGKEAKKEVKVLISGAGADELWGGYQRHTAFDFYLKREGLLLLMNTLAKKLPLSRQWIKFFSAIHTDSRRTFINFCSLMPLPKDLFGDYERLFPEKEFSYKSALEFDRHNYLVQDVLRIQDNALMAHGIEGRSPYLDSGMIDLWNQVTNEEDLKGKVWIKGCLEDLDLGWIAKRKKFGFGLPLEEWLSIDGPVSKKVFATLKNFEKTHGEFMPQEMRAISKNPEQASKLHFLILYNLFLLADWAKLNEL